MNGSKHFFMNESYQTILLEVRREVLFIQFNRPDRNNSINRLMIDELLAVMQDVGQEQSIKVIVLRGNEQFFCAGMDFNFDESENLKDMNADAYYELLERITLSSKVVIAQIDGVVNAGGVGIVAACDIAIANKKATIGLSEALFGLLPACVLPFLMRRIGAHKSQWMTLITDRITAERAYQIGVVDEISDNTQEVLRRNLIRLTKLDSDTVLKLKRYVTDLWFISKASRELAVQTTNELMQSDKVQNNINNFVKKKEFPWSKS